MTNCFRIEVSHNDGNRAETKEGFIIKEDKHSYFLRLASEDAFNLIYLSAGLDIERLVPTEAEWRSGTKRFQLDDADIVKVGAAHHQLVACGGDAQSTLILVKSSPDIVFNAGKLRPHFQNTSASIGADSPGLVVQCGSHQSSVKQQLFRLYEGESVLFCDSVGEVTKITARTSGIEPICVRATEGEVADYVLVQARVRGKKNRRTQGWCYYALRELGCSKQMREFHQMFPSYQPRN